MHTIHLIGNAHIDPAWLWRWTDGYAEVRATFRAALDRLNEYPGFVFTCAGACYYQWIEDSCPDMFEEIRLRVSEGRWVLVNGWWLQPDCNIPCGESFARHSLYAQRYFQEKFGRICTVGYNVDSFGHNAMLPQILRKSGMDSYVFMRPGDHEKANVPNLFSWESPDGSRVTTYKIQGGYGLASPDEIAQRISLLRGLAQKDDCDMMLFYGVGNHGGGPTIAVMDRMESVMGEQDGGDLVFSSPDAFFAAQKGKPLPVVRDELQIHAIGCYSAYLAVKQRNRLCETALLTAEKTAALARMLTGAPIPRARLKDAWTRLLFNQFHDILCGCCIREVYDDVFAAFGYIGHVAEEIRNFAAQKISWQIDTLGGDSLPRSKEADWKLWGLEKRGTPMVAFNPLPFAARVPIAAPGELASVTDDEGASLPVQRVRSSVTNGAEDKYDTLFPAELPALGYRVFYLHKGARAPETSYPAVESPALENECLRVLFDATTGMPSSIVDKRTGRQALSGSMRMLVIDETHSDTWGHGLFEYRDEVGAFVLKNAIAVESGPVRSKIRATLAYASSLIEADFSLCAGEAYLDIALRIDWREKHRMLKMECPVACDCASYDAEIPFGAFTRPADGKEKPMQRYVNVYGAAGGLVLANDSGYGVDVKGSLIRQTVLRSPIFADHFGKRDALCQYMEQGEHFTRYRLAPHMGQINAERVASLLNTKPAVVCETYHKGPLGGHCAGIDISCAHVTLAALKEAESGDGYVLRLAETRGEPARADIALPLAGRRFEASFTPWEVKTFLAPYDAALPVSETRLIEM